MVVISRDKVRVSWGIQQNALLIRLLNSDPAMDCRSLNPTSIGNVRGGMRAHLL